MRGYGHRRADIRAFGCTMIYFGHLDKVEWVFAVASILLAAASAVWFSFEPRGHHFAWLLLLPAAIFVVVIEIHQNRRKMAK
jgi:hypothetical protein